MAFKEKFRLLYKAHRLYFWAAGAAVILGVILFVSAFTVKQTVLRGMLVGTGVGADYQSLSRGFVESLGLDSSRGQIQFMDDIAYSANPEQPGDNFGAIDLLTEYTARGYADFMLGETEVMESLAYSDFFVDLREVLTPEQLDALEGKLLYVDKAVIRQLEQMALSQEYPEDFAVPDPASPQRMEEPVPVLVNVTGHETLKPLFGENTVLLAAAQNGGRSEILRALVEYLADIHF